jgi:tripartite-type tricarboxylate transporter receptor subunit TctC
VEEDVRAVLVGKKMTGRNAMKFLTVCLAAAATFLLAAAAPSARADDYPTHPITLVVPYTPGGSTEILARIVAQKLGERLGKPVVVENKPGAGTVIGTTAVAQTDPDGYALLMATPTPLAINVAVHKSLPYDPVADFVPLVMVASAPFFLVVNPSLPVQNVKELIAYAKANPSALSYGSGGVGAPHHLYMELFKSMTGTQMTHVPYKGSLPALDDVVAGHIQLMFCDIPPAAGMVAAGKVRALGVSTKARIAAYPDVPTVAEAGVPGFDVAGWFMIAAPSKTPPAVVERLHDELLSVMAEPDIKERIVKLSLVPLPTPSVADMRTFVKTEIVRWGKIVEQAGIAGTE